MTEYEVLSLVLGATTLFIISSQLYLIYKTYKADHERKLKQSTIEYVNNIRKVYRPIFTKLNKKFGNKIISVGEIEEEDLIDTKEFLGIMEHLATGVNVGVFDILIIEKMSGGYFVSMYHKLKPYIDQTRKDTTNQKLYIEFEHMVRDIENMRDKRSSHANIKHS